MPRPPAPCGTYPAYRRHLRKHESVDAACRRAQREHDADRSSAQDREARDPVYITARPKSLEEIAEEYRQQLLVKARALVEALEDDHSYNVIDRFIEIDPLLDTWTEALDDVEESKGWPYLSEETRAKLLAGR